MYIVPCMIQREYRNQNRSLFTCTNSCVKVIKACFNKLKKKEYIEQ